MTGRHAHTIDEIKGMLLGHLDRVLAVYAPERSGSYTDGALYWTLNPGRADNSVGSFHVDVSNTDQRGRWYDHATKEGGDVLDLIGLACSTDLAGAFKEARAFLNLDDQSPAAMERRQKLEAENKRKRAAAERDRRARKEAMQKRGQALFLSAQEKIAGTPVESYLRDTRQIDLRQVGRQPGAIRYAPNCGYFGHNGSGAVEKLRDFPAMVASIIGANGRTIGCHRTYLQKSEGGRYVKASVPTPKKVLGSVIGGHIPIWTGLGPRQGKGAPLSKCPAGTRVMITEGIEDALSVVMFTPELRVVAAVTLGNMSEILLPENVAEVVLVADQDTGEKARDLLEKAKRYHAAQKSNGELRRVFMVRNVWGGKDFNDALRAATPERVA